MTASCDCVTQTLKAASGPPAALSKEFDEIYTYDGVHRLKDMARGLLNTNRTALTSKTFAQCWTLDTTGNWSGFREDDTGDGTWDLEQARSANPVNEIGTITNSVGSAWVQPAYNPAGSMTTMPQPNDPTKGYTATYDAWNRLVKIVDAPTSHTVSEYAYDGARRQVVTKAFTSGALSEIKHLYFTSPTTWRCLEERLGASPDSLDPDRHFVWGERYFDDLIASEIAPTSVHSGSSSSGSANRVFMYVLQDVSWNSTASVDINGHVTLRAAFTAYGNEESLNATFDFSLLPALEGIPFLYGGHRLDTCSGAYVLRNRWLHPAAGRFLSRDPLRHIDGPNLYAAWFVPNSTDPLGLRGLMQCERCIVQFAHANIFDLTPEELVLLNRNVNITTADDGRITDVPLNPWQRIGNTLPNNLQQIILLNPEIGGVTLGYDIYLRKCNHPCDRTGGADNADDSLIAHELVHTIQTMRDGNVDQFLENYLQDYWYTRESMALTGDDAYRCLGYEMQAYALQGALNSFFNNPANKSAFNAACKKGTTTKDPAMQSASDALKKDYERRLKAFTDDCIKKSNNAKGAR